MSKMSQLAMELDELAAEKGFESWQQAKDAGCIVEFVNNRPTITEPLELAHRDWQKEKDTVLKYLQEDIRPWINCECHAIVGEVDRVIKFVKESEL